MFTLFRVVTLDKMQGMKAYEQSLAAEKKKEARKEAKKQEGMESDDEEPDDTVADRSNTAHPVAGKKIKSRATKAPPAPMAGKRARDHGLAGSKAGPPPAVQPPISRSFTTVASRLTPLTQSSTTANAQAKMNPVACNNITGPTMVPKVTILAEASNAAQTPDASLSTANVPSKMPTHMPTSNRQYSTPGLAKARARSVSRFPRPLKAFYT